MTETFYKKGIYKVNPSEFGGKICASDFNRKTTLSEMAARIMADRQFDQRCRKETAQINQPDKTAKTDNINRTSAQNT